MSSACKSQEELAEAPVLIVCLDHTRRDDQAAAPKPASIEELPAKCTVGQLPKLLGISPNTQILVRP